MRRTLLLIFLSSVLFAIPAHADWLVTNDGARIETKGAWNVKGGIIVFTAPNGTLSSIRKSEIDLDASAAATMEAKNPPPPPAEEEEKEKPEPVLVLTNKDLGPRSAGAANPKQPAAGEAQPGSQTANPGSSRAGDATEGAAAGDLKVVRWEANDSSVGRAVVVTGIIRNAGKMNMNGVSLNVDFVDGEGKVLTNINAQVRNTSLRAGAATNFRAILRDVERSEGEPAFNVTGQPAPVSSSTQQNPADSNSNS